MGNRTDYSKDSMVVKTTGYGSTENPAAEEAVKSFTAEEDGHVVGVALIWDAQERGVFMVRVGGGDRYPVVSGAAGGAGVTSVIGRVPFSAGDTVEVVAADDLTGTAVAAIIYADA